MIVTTKRIEISVSHAMKMLQVSQMTILRYLEDGTLEGYRLTPRGWWRVYLDSVEKLVNARQAQEPR